MEIDALSTTTCELKGRRWPRPSAEPLRPPAASPRVSSRPPSMLHADLRTNIHSLSHLTPLTPPGRRPAEARCEVRPVRRHRSRPVAATDRRRPFLIAATGSVCDSGTRPDPPGWQGGSQHGQTTCQRQSFDGRATRFAGGKSSRLRLAGKVVSRPPAV